MTAPQPQKLIVPESERFWHKTSLQTIGSMLHALEILHTAPRILPLTASDLLPYILSDKKSRKLYRKAARKSRQNYRQKLINRETLENELNTIKTAKTNWFDHQPEMLKHTVKINIIALLRELTIPEIKEYIAARPN